MDYVRFGVIAIAVFGALWFLAWEFFSRATGAFDEQLGAAWAERYSYAYVVCAFGVALIDYYVRKRASKGK
jgi:hypothetical protein